MQISIGEKLANLQRVAPKRTRHAQLYHAKAQTLRSYSRIRMHVIMRSLDGDLRLHAAIFNKAAGKNPAEWGAWMKKNFREIYTKSILAYMSRTENQSWQVLTIIGWTGERLARHGKRVSNRPALAARRHKTKRQGAKRGKNNLRRGHRNRKR